MAHRPAGFSDPRDRPMTCRIPRIRAQTGHVPPVLGPRCVSSAHEAARRGA